MPQPRLSRNPLIRWFRPVCAVESQTLTCRLSAWRATTYHFNEVDTQRLGWWVDAYFEYKPRPDFSLKLEADNLATHGLEQIRAFYDPFRDQAGGALSSIDNRSPRFGPYFQLRARKTFG